VNYKESKKLAVTSSETDNTAEFTNIFGLFYMRELQGVYFVEMHRFLCSVEQEDVLLFGLCFSQCSDVT
jgi:hypothetical protein